MACVFKHTALPNRDFLLDRVRVQDYVLPFLPSCVLSAVFALKTKTD